MTYFQIDGLLILTNKNATKSPGHQNPPKINDLSLVKFGVFVFWWQNRLFVILNLKCTLHLLYYFSAEDYHKNKCFTLISFA